MWAASDHFRQSVAKLVTHSAKFWNFLDERRTTAKKNNVSQISPRPPNQCWSLFPALWSFRVWSTLCRGEGGKFNLGLGCSKIRQQRSSVSLLLKPIVGMVNVVQIIISDIAHSVYLRFTVFSKFSKLLFVLHILAYSKFLLRSWAKC